MSWLLLQFLVIALFPLGFIALVIYSWRQRPAGRPGLTRWWVMTLLLLTLWSTRQLTPYLGREINDLVSYFWRAFAHYPLVLSGSTLLLATTHYINRPLPHRGYYLIGPFLTMIALILDPALWGWAIPDLTAAGLTFRHFDLWANIWVAAWLFPTLTAWVWSDLTLRAAPISIYRNQVNYWVVINTIVLAAGSLALLRDFLVAQQGGAILLLIGTFLGTLALASSDLPDLPNTIRRLGYHFSRGFVVFFIAGLALYALAQFIANSAGQTTNIVIIAALLTFVLLGLLAAVNRLARRWIFGRPRKIDTLLLAEPVLAGYLTPEQLAERLDQEIRQRFGARGSWVAAVEEAPNGRLVIRPLGGSKLPEPAILDGSSPLVRHLLENERPLTPEDIAHLPDFAQIAGYEQDHIDSWGAALYLPLRIDQRLVGLVALDFKQTGERYNRREFEELIVLGRVGGMQLAQTQALQALTSASKIVYNHNQALVEERLQLKGLVALYQQLSGILSSAELRRPYTEMAATLRQIEQELPVPAEFAPDPPGRSPIDHAHDAPRPDR